MIRHVVLWKLDNSYSTEEKNEIKKQLNDKLSHLVGNIEQLCFLEVSFNSEDAVQSNFDIMLDSAFETIKDLQIYQEHPEHIKVGEYIKSLKLQRAAIDYEY
jgi:hypothetical protein